MGKLFYLIGPSASGKDSLARALLARFPGELLPVTMTTTRPLRSGEQEGEAYRFISQAQLEELRQAGKVIESRTYQTVHGPWTYATVDDGSFDLAHHSYLMTGTLESFEKTRSYFGESLVVPLYIEVDRGLRLERALRRERAQKEPKYAELCRRFLADEEDFSQEKVEAFHFSRVFRNHDFQECLKALEERIREEAL
ncbi:MAG: guanylate kinase [Lachnospiraceae bacterium]|nr:guanylate kinase [Lachnospiraceae bacterium]